MHIVTGLKDHCVKKVQVCYSLLAAQDAAQQIKETLTSPLSGGCVHVEIWESTHTVDVCRWTEGV